jgi:hypothetical protein
MARLPSTEDDYQVEYLCYPGEVVAHLCFLLDPKMRDIPFVSWEEQEAFEIVLELKEGEPWANSP